MRLIASERHGLSTSDIVRFVKGVGSLSVLNENYLVFFDSATLADYLFYSVPSLLDVLYAPINLHLL